MTDTARQTTINVAELVMQARGFGICITTSILRKCIDYDFYSFLFLQFNFAAFNGRIGINDRNVSHVVTVDILLDDVTTLIIPHFTINILCGFIGSGICMMLTFSMFSFWPSVRSVYGFVCVCSTETLLRR